MTYTSPIPPLPKPSVDALSGSFREGELTYAPAFLSGEWASKYLYSQGIQWDTLAEYLRLGVLQRFPEYCQPEGLVGLGSDRRIFRGLSESDENYALRLKEFRETWALAGNAPTLLRQLWALMTPDVTRIRYVVNGYDPDGVQFADWWTIDSAGELSSQRVSPSNWNWDGKTDSQIRFWVIVYRSDLVPAKWGIPPYTWAEDGLIWAGAPGTNSRDWLKDTYAIVSTFKAAGSALGPWGNFSGGLIVADPTVTGVWGSGGPFDPDLPPGSPMPDGLWANPVNRTTEGAVYLSGLA